jgi:hypothetical protein
MVRFNTCMAKQQEMTETEYLRLYRQETKLHVAFSHRARC